MILQKPVSLQLTEDMIWCYRIVNTDNEHTEKFSSEFSFSFACLLQVFSQETEMLEQWNSLITDDTLSEYTKKLIYEW